MPLRYLQLRGQDPSYDLVSLRGIYNGENGIVGKGLDEALDVDDWDNWMRWDVGTNELSTPNEEHSDIPLDSLCSPDTTFSDFEFPVKNPASASTLVQSGTIVQDAPFDLDDDNESLLFSPISYTGSMLLPEADHHHDLAFNVPPLVSDDNREDLLGVHQDSYSKDLRTTPETKPARPRLSRPLQINTAARTTRKKRAEETLPDTSCLSKKRGHNAIEKRYRTNLNEKINCLRDALPSLCKSGLDTKTGEEDSEAEDIENQNGQQKFGKAAILTRALAYIQHLETNTQKLGTEMETLKSRIRAFERLAMSGSDISEDESNASSVSVKGGTTLEDIQQEFRQLKTNPRSRSRSTSELALPRKRTKRQGKVC